MIKSTQMIDASEALPGRAHAMPSMNRHYVLDTSLRPPFPAGSESALFGMGCFWGAERRFWEQPGVYTTAVGYSGGYTPNPTYEEVCSGHTGHNEAVLIIFDPLRISYEQLLALFWEGHNPTQGMRQGNDVGTQYRSAIYVSSADQNEKALQSREHYARRLIAQGIGSQITTEIAFTSDFYYAEDYHQQYLAKNPGGYCGLGGVGVCY